MKIKNRVLAVFVVSEISFVSDGFMAKLTYEVKILAVLLLLTPRIYFIDR